LVDVGRMQVVAPAPRTPVAPGACSMAHLHETIRCRSFDLPRVWDLTLDSPAHTGSCGEATPNSSKPCIRPQRARTPDPQHASSLAGPGNYPSRPRQTASEPQGTDRVSAQASYKQSAIGGSASPAASGCLYGIFISFNVTPSRTLTRHHASVEHRRKRLVVAWTWLPKLVPIHSDMDVMPSSPMEGILDAAGCDHADARSRLLRPVARLCLSLQPPLRSHR
jgi:hypothetical protein